MEEHIFTIKIKYIIVILLLLFKKSLLRYNDSNDVKDARRKEGIFEGNGLRFCPSLQEMEETTEEDCIETRTYFIMAESLSFLSVFIL